jgi:hypothetical protein
VVKAVAAIFGTELMVIRVSAALKYQPSSVSADRVTSATGSGSATRAIVWVGAEWFLALSVAASPRLGACWWQSKPPRLGHIMIAAGPRLRRFLLAALGVAALSFGYPATAAAEPPACPKNTVTIGNQGQVVNVPQQSQVCDDDPMSDGLLGDLPMMGNLPGLGGIL